MGGGGGGGGGGQGHVYIEFGRKWVYVHPLDPCIPISPISSAICIFQLDKIWLHGYMYFEYSVALLIAVYIACFLRHFFAHVTPPKREEIGSIDNDVSSY